MKMPKIIFDRESFTHFDDAIQKEWLITNGLGGYSSCSVPGVNTRKYHGLLIAAISPPKDRRVMLTKLDEDILVGHATHRLGTNEFQNGFYPQGYEFLTEFSISPFPKYVYTAESFRLTKTIFILYGKNVLVTNYEILNKSGSDVQMKVFPIVNSRPFHTTTEKWKVQQAYRQENDERETTIVFRSPESALLLKSTDGRYVAEEQWVEHVYLREEARRGENCLDDCLRPGYFEFKVKAGKREDHNVIAVADRNEANARKTLDDLPSSSNGLNLLCKDEIKRHENLLTHYYLAHKNVRVSDWLSWLIMAADSFVVSGRSEEERLVIAGYPWFESWGRDTFVSLPGLLLVTEKFKDARKVLLSYAGHCKAGLIPNFIPEEGEQPSYNTVDATLWYVNAAYQYLKYTGDLNFVHNRLWKTLTEIIDDHVHGTNNGIQVDSDGLLRHDAQLTWMDACFEGKPVTPRTGKAVEIQALWYNALKIMELLSRKLGEISRAEDLRRLAERTEKSFTKFWNGERNCLYDVLTPEGHDPSLRPNQIIAAALDFTMLDKDKAADVVDTVERELLTPYGLRTLEHGDPRYIGSYVGDRRARDMAYHNGTVWPWLIGPFTTAFLRVKGYKEQARAKALRLFLLPLFVRQILEAELGTLGEIFDGDMPHRPRGCPAQAWSIAEPLRAYAEEIMQTSRSLMCMKLAE